MNSNAFFSFTAIAAAALLTGCASSGSSTATVSNPYSATGSSTLGEVQVNTMRVFGDSYSDPDYTSYLGSINWSEQLQANGLVSENLNYAIGGARASSGEVRSFDQQIDTALSGTAIADGDLTVVYLGHNDIGRTGSPDNLVNSSADYLTGINELIAAGAADENRRIFVTQIHDWSRNPGVADSTASQVTTWNTMIAGIANTHANIVAVDMYTAFERIFTTPEAYGFANVTTADSSRASIDTLYTDSTHFGSLGQAVISRVYQHYLTRGWDWANSVSAGTDSAAQLSADIDAGTLVLGTSFGNTAGQTLQHGFRLLPLGITEKNALSPSSSRTSQVFRPFSEQAAFSQQSAPSGLALDFGLGSSEKPDDARIGVALFQYQQSTDLASAQDHQSRQYTSSALSAYWHQPLAGGMFSAQVSHLNLDFTNQSQDDLVNLNLVNENTGDTLSMVNKLRYPMRSGGLSFTPWVSLTGQTHSLDAARFSSLYTSDVKYSSSRMNEWLSGVGVDIQSSPIFLNGGAQVQFGGSLNHTSSLYRDAITVSMEESNTAGFVQSEVFQSEKINSTLLSLQANVLLNKQVRLSATYGTTLQDVKDTSSVSVLAHFRY